jgi:hypothetical protein
MLASEIDCHWIGEIEMCGGGDGFDCTYEQWVKLFREETKQAAKLAVAPVVLTTDQQAKAQVADGTGESITLECGHRIERRDGSWVVIDEHGDFLIDVEQSYWSADEDDELPALRFQRAEEAWLAWLNADAVAAARAVRRAAATMRLDDRAAS